MIDQSLTQANSLALVQIFLNASLACIAHTRELIPWTSPCFRTRYIGQIGPALAIGGGDMYTSFQGLDAMDAGHGQEIRILIRGGHSKADQILDMLEKGVFETLKRGYLDTLQIFVTKSGEPHTILEAYSFVFTYTQGHVSSIKLNPTDHSVMLENFPKSFKTVIRTLLRSLKDLPRLPARRRLGMSLVYNNECPASYQPRGFVDQADFGDGHGQEICDILWKNKGEEVGRLDAGQHQVAVGVCALHCEQEKAPVDPGDTAMSKQLQAMQKTSSQRSNNLVSTLKDSGRPSKRKTHMPVSNAKRLKTGGAQKLQANSQKQLWDKDDIEGQSMHKNASPSAAQEPVLVKKKMSMEGSPALVANDGTDTCAPWDYSDDRDMAPAKSSLTGPSPVTPRHGRKISISRMLIDIDRSPSVASMSMEESCRRETELDYASDFTAPSTVTAE